MKTLGAIIAGGASRRMGQDKAFVTWRGKPLVAHVIERLEPQVDELVICVKSDASRFMPFGVHIILDELDIGTPLGGLHAALKYAAQNNFDSVLSTPCDTPLLPNDYCIKLRGDNPAIAAFGDQLHYLSGFWPISMLATFDSLDSPRVKDFGAMVNAKHIYWPESESDPFINVNTMQDLSDLP